MEHSDAEVDSNELDIMEKSCEQLDVEKEGQEFQPLGMEGR